MISKRAVKEYLTRPLRNLNEMKRWSRAKIARKIDALKPSAVFLTEPRHYQKICFYSLIKLPRNMQLLHMGLGKTKIVMDAIRWLTTAGMLQRVLVLVPNVINIEGWRIELAKHASDLTYSCLEGSHAMRLEALREQTQLCIGTYAGLTSLICKNIGGKMRIDVQELQRVAELFDGIIWDESTALMNPRSLQFQIATKISKGYALRVGMTGTPLGRDPHVLWSQFFAVDRGESLGPTLGLYRQAFFSAKPQYWGGVNYEFRQSKADDLRRLMAHSSIRYSAGECLDLPPKVLMERPIVMPDEAWSYYQALLDQSRDQATGNMLIDVEGLFVRLRQITSGFVSIDGNPSPLKENPKLDVLMELIDELPDGEKMVVFNEFIFSGSEIARSLKDRGIKHARLYSGTRDKRAELRKFNDDPKCKIFVVNSQSGSQGLNLQVAPYVIFYEAPVSPIVRQQAEARCHRQGQSKTVFLYDIFARCTIDEKILRFLREGKDLFKALVDGSVSLQEK